jgi:hypothetical protein
MRIEDKIGYVGFFVCVVIFLIALVVNTINGL